MAEALPSCTERLLAARLAYHQLMTGTANVVSVGYGDRQIQYRNDKNDVDRLQLYIRGLEQDPECGEFDKQRKPFGMIY